MIQSGDPRFEEALRRFDLANASDPNRETDEAGTVHPRELLYARRLTDWVLRLCPEAPLELRLAARCQHLCRWMIPRSGYEMSRAGYLKWRNDLKKFHAEKAGSILREAGYADETIRRVQALVRKEGFPHDPETRVLEDALCLVFLQYQLAGLAGRTPDDKMINALRKSWLKMTAAARDEALKLSYGERERRLLDQALKVKSEQ